MLQAECFSRSLPCGLFVTALQLRNMWPQVSWEAPFTKLSFASQSVCCWSFPSEGELWKLQVRFATSVTDFLLSYTAVMWSCYTEISWELLVRHLAQNIKIASSGLWTSHLLSYTETVLDDKGLHKAVKGHGCILCTRLHFFIFINFCLLTWLHGILFPIFTATGHYWLRKWTNPRYL